MIATAFDEENLLLHAPPGMTTEQVQPLPVWTGSLTNGLPAVISCWKLTAAELEEINRTGRVWLVVMGNSMPPVCPEGISPFKGG